MTFFGMRFGLHQPVRISALLALLLCVSTNFTALAEDVDTADSVLDLAMHQRNPQAAQKLYSQAEAMFTAQNDATNVKVCQNLMRLSQATELWMDGNETKATAMIDQSIAGLQELNKFDLAAKTLNALAYLQHGAYNYVKAGATFRLVAADYVRAGEPILAAEAMSTSAVEELLRGNFADAKKYANEALPTLLASKPSKLAQARCLNVLCGAACGLGDFAGAYEYGQQALKTANIEQNLSIGLYYHGVAAGKLGKQDEAFTNLSTACRLATKNGWLHLVTSYWEPLVVTAEKLNRLAELKPLSDEVNELSEEWKQTNPEISKKATMIIAAYERKVGAAGEPQTH